MPFFDLGVETRLFYTDDPAGAGSPPGRAGTPATARTAGAGAGGGAGDAPPLVLIHGWCCDSHDWNHQIPAFQRRHRVITLDLRGHGRSTGSKGLRPRVLAADVAALLAERGVTAASGGVVAVGHSLGGMVAAALSVEHPGLVRGVVTIEPAYGLPTADVERTAALVAGLGSPRATARLERYLAALAGPQAPDHLVTWHRRRALGVPVEVVRAAFAGMWLDDDQFGRQEEAAAYLRGRTSPFLTFFANRRAARAEWERTLLTGPLDEVRQLPGGHWLHQEQPTEFNSIVLDWVGRVTRAGRTGPADQSSRLAPGVSFL